MPWSCPACHLPIAHSEREDRPRPNTPYRCHICRLELIADPDTQKLTVAAERSDDKSNKIRRTD